MNDASRRVAVLLATALAVSGCSRDARLYPANLEAGPAAVKAKFTDAGMGTGPVELTLPDGEVLRGEFGTISTATYGFGSGYATSGTRSVLTTGSVSSVPGSMPGRVALIGDRGTRGECEYQVNSWTSSGTGMCKFSNGAVYNLHF